MNRLNRPPSSEDPLALATTRQRRAANPDTSAWVDASAGSGKTRVLVDRVLRLLLRGVAPHQILCLTFTKAAAANMANRLRQELALWARAPASSLAARLRDLTGEPPEPETEATARQLFARLLDAPGGLQFLTLHSFCQSLLARFPLESGVPVGFRVLEGRASQRLLAEALRQVLARPSAAVVHLLAVLDEDNFKTLTGDLIAQRGRFAHALSHAGDATKAAAQVRAQLGISSDDTEESALAAFVEGLPRHAMRDALPLLQASEKVTDREVAKEWALWLAGDDAEDTAERVDPFLWSVLKKKDFAPRTTTPTKAFAEKHPHILSLITDIQEQALRFVEKRRALRSAESTISLLFMAEELLAHYRALKQRHVALDFEDLIEHAQALLSGDQTPWVLFKLDGGLSHVLVDEAQDTNPAQWNLLQSLTEDFFVGETARSARNPARTVFAVGDYKQSIFSFQGAEPDSFLRARDYFSLKVEAAQHTLLRETFFTSFRSSQGVLEVVNRVFGTAEAARGLGGTFPPHVAAKNLPADVDVWPLAVATHTPDQTPWPLPKADGLQPLSSSLSPPLVRAAEALARHLQRLKREEGVAEGDVLVLVPRRNAFVGALTRACKAAGLAVSGADRMKLKDQIVVEDILALLSSLLLPEDDLTLATALKGPFIGLTEESLLHLCQNRPSSLWVRVQREEEAATAWLYALMERADRVSPYSLLSGLLAEPCPKGASGRAALLARLGPEAEDPLDELLAAALAYEQEETPTLQGFLAWVQESDTEIKREMEQAGGALRIMTVHGAKGLEAPVVVLADAFARPRHHALVMFNPADPEALPLMGPRKEDESAVLQQRRREIQARTEAEYHRLLYVALTRAERRLIVVGWRDNRKVGEKTARKADSPPAPTSPTWYDRIAEGVRALPGVERRTAAAFSATEGWQGEWLHYHHTPRGTGSSAHDSTGASAAGHPQASLPAWVASPPPPEPVPARPLSPSKPTEADEEPPVLSPVGAATPSGHTYRRGALLHRLLQTLPALDPASRAHAGHAWLVAQGVPATQAHTWVREVENVITHPDFSALFGPESRAEVPLTGQVGSRLLTGRIDRLALTPDTVWVVDFKARRTPAHTVEEVPTAYLRQMAAYRAALSNLYPGRVIRAVLLWTQGPTLMELPHFLLDRHAP